MPYATNLSYKRGIIIHNFASSISRGNASAWRDAPCVSFVIIPLIVLFPLCVEGGGATKAAADEAAAFWGC